MAKTMPNSRNDGYPTTLQTITDSWCRRKYCLLPLGISCRKLMIRFDFQRPVDGWSKTIGLDSSYRRWKVFWFESWTVIQNTKMSHPFNSSGWVSPKQGRTIQNTAPDQGFPSLMPVNVWKSKKSLLCVGSSTMLMILTCLHECWSRCCFEAMWKEIQTLSWPSHQSNQNWITELSKNHVPCPLAHFFDEFYAKSWNIKIICSFPCSTFGKYQS